MKKYLVKINYHKVYGDNGTVYRKGYTINHHIYQHFYNSLQAEAAMEKDYYRKLWLSTPLSWSKSKLVVYMNLTQAAYFKSILIKLKANNQLDFNEKRAEYDANTYLIVK